MAGELAFFEIGVKDTERGRAFYERLFGWKFEPGPPICRRVVRGCEWRRRLVIGSLQGQDPSSGNCSRRFGSERFLTAGR